MLPIPRPPELWPLLARLLFGLVLFGLGIALTIIADLGLGPWDVLHQGVSQRTGIPIGTVIIIVSVVVLVAWIPLKERIGLGTIANAIVIGATVDLALLALPERLDLLLVRWAALLMGVLLVAIGSGFYIGAGMGPGPRDGLMTGLTRVSGRPIGLVRAVIEIGVLVLGWSLGGTVGIGTIVFAFGIGPLVQFFLKRLQVAQIIDDGSSSKTRTTDEY